MITTTYDEKYGRVDHGITTVKKVVFLTPWPTRPTVVVNGAYYVSHTLTGFSLDRDPEEPLEWFAQEVPIGVFDIDDVRRVLQEDTATKPLCRLEQPGDTLTYKARQAGAKVMSALDGLTPWAQHEVLTWALGQVQETIHDDDVA